MRRLIFALSLLALASAAPAMPVSSFLATADKLTAKGPLAIFSGDLKVLLRQIKSDADRLRGENVAAEKAGRPKAYCTPPGGVKLKDSDILAAMQAVPPAARASTDTSAALRAYLARRFPCRR